MNQQRRDPFYDEFLFKKHIPYMDLPEAGDPCVFMPEMKTEIKLRDAQYLKNIDLMKGKKDLIKAELQSYFELLRKY